MKKEPNRGKENRVAGTKPITDTENASAFAKMNALSLMLWEYPDVMDIEQVCRVLRISTKTGYRLIAKGKLPSLKVGRSYRIPKIYLLSYLGLIPQSSLSDNGFQGGVKTENDD